MEDKKERKTGKTVFAIVSVAILFVYFSLLTFLHYNQAFYTTTGRFESDLFAHIEMALDGWGYSIMAVILRIFSLLPGNAFYFAVALFLAFCGIETIVLSFYFTKKYTDDSKLSFVISIMAAFVMPMFVQSVQPYRYVGYQSPSIWHNSTYIVMKVGALASLYIYFLISEKYKESMRIIDVVLFSILLALTTSVKTNFVLAFAPAALLFLIIDALSGVEIKRIIICALTILPSRGVMAFQKYVLFGSETGNSIIIDPLYSVYLRTDKPYITMILSAAFPVAVFLYNIFGVLKDTLRDFKEKRGIKSHRVFLFMWTMWFSAFMMLLLLRETGARELDDNFAWGYDFALFGVFLIGLVYFSRNIKRVYNLFFDKDIESKNTLEKVTGICYVAMTLAILFYHLYCGVLFFIRLLGGATFFMY